MKCKELAEYLASPSFKKLNVQIEISNLRSLDEFQTRFDFNSIQYDLVNKVIILTNIY
jgi:hypothetical protein